MLTTPQARELSGFSLTYLAALARSGQIEAKQYGRDWLIYKDSLQAFRNRQRQKPGPKGPTGPKKRKQKKEPGEGASNA